MEMTFGEAHNIWSRVVSGDETLTEDEVKAAAKTFDDFIDKLGERVCQSKQEFEDARLAQEQDAIEKKSKAAESDQCQL